ELPIKESHPTPMMEKDPLVQGWSWLTPYCDGETLLLATDEGVLGIFGIKQIRNDDPPLFPAIRQEKVSPEPWPGNVNLFPDGRTCLATAFDTLTGNAQWQRQLGMVVQTTPVVSSRKRETSPERVVALLAAAPDLGCRPACPGRSPSPWWATT